MQLKCIIIFILVKKLFVSICINFSRLLCFSTMMGKIGVIFICIYILRLLRLNKSVKIFVFHNGRQCLFKIDICRWFYFIITAIQNLRKLPVRKKITKIALSALVFDVIFTKIYP